MGLEVAPRLAAASVHFSTRKYAPRAAVAQRSLSLTAAIQALSVPSFWVPVPRLRYVFRIFRLFILCFAIAVLVFRK